MPNGIGGYNAYGYDTSGNSYRFNYQPTFGSYGYGGPSPFVQRYGTNYNPFNTYYPNGVWQGYRVGGLGGYGY